MSNFIAAEEPRHLHSFWIRRRISIYYCILSQMNRNKTYWKVVKCQYVFSHLYYNNIKYSSSTRFRFTPPWRSSLHLLIDRIDIVINLVQIRCIHGFRVLSFYPWDTKIQVSLWYCRFRTLSSRLWRSPPPRPGPDSFVIRYKDQKIGVGNRLV
jgi:hypothetical protein